MRSISIVALLLFAAPPPVTSAVLYEDKSNPSSDQPERIVTPTEVRETTHPAASWPLRVAFYPCHLINSGMESGLVSFEKNRMRERLNYWSETLRRHGISAMIGGLGEGTGMGLGGSYTLRSEGGSDLRFLGRGSLAKGYQEYDIRWTLPVRKASFIVETSYQWRPDENFYGLGMDSSQDARTKFALRQTWGGLRFEVAPKSRLRFGAEYKLAWLSSMASSNPAYAPIDTQFPDLPGFGQLLRLESTGAYVDADGIRSEYGMGGMLHAGASLQQGLGRSNLSYFSYEGRLEGRLPIAKDRSVFVAQGSFELTRPRRGSDATPFYLLPHIGGSSTLRGFALDRFYGKNIVMATLEYRYRIHPEFQTFFFFDEGQMFDQTSDLTWLNWQRDFGFGVKMVSEAGSLFRVDLAWGHEGFVWHIIWGERERRPLGGPIRYGVYRR